MRGLITLILFLFLSSCKPLLTATPLPPKNFLRVGYHPSLRPWAAQLSLCSENIPGTALVFYEISDLDSREAEPSLDIMIFFADQWTVNGFATKIGEEEMTWIVNQANPLSQISYAQLENVYAGVVVNWAELTDGKFDVLINRWIYPSGDVLNKSFFLMFQGLQAPLSGASLAPDPEAMLAAVSQNAGALGFIPTSWLDEAGARWNIKTATFPEAMQNENSYPLDILAITPTEPEIEIVSLLHCLEENTR